MEEYSIEEINTIDNHPKIEKMEYKKISFWQRLTKSKIPSFGKERVIKKQKKKKFNKIIFFFLINKNKQMIYANQPERNSEIKSIWNEKQSNFIKTYRYNFLTVK